MIPPGRMDGDGRKVAARIVIEVWTDGVMSVGGSIGDAEWALAALDNAKDAIRSRVVRQRANLMIIPPSGVSLP